MPYDKEFPALAKATNGMEFALLLEVARNLTKYDVDVRIDYERWVQFRKEYEQWSRAQSGNPDSITEKEKDDFDKTAHS